MPLVLAYFIRGAIVALAVHTITWDTFNQTAYVVEQGGTLLQGVNDDPMPDGDIIWMYTNNGPGGNEIEIVLETDQDITWYKEIKAFDVHNNALGWVSTQDHAHGPVSMLISLNNAHALVFTKAKAFGIHTGEYVVYDLSAKAGKQLVFSWQKD